MARGILQMVAATVLFVCMNATGKILSAHLPPVEVVWARSAGHFVFILALLGPGHGWWRLFETNNLRLQVGRSFLQVSSQMLFFTAIGHVQLADATAVSFTAPLIVAALAGPLLAERVEPSHWAAIGAGFAGALIVIRPGAGVSAYLLLILGSSVCYALYQLLTRRVAAYDRPQTSVTYSALVGTIVLSILVPFTWTTPSATQWAGLAALGVLGGLGHYLIAHALAVAAASIISPFHYIQLIWAAALGYLVFGDVPSGFTWLGAAVIIASGLFIAVTQARR
ncbi:MAG TPA: DMT family transporter [Candidatus Acidoferrum sp.]|nr:DMT family transporter [Candidatus Acidoferrum sp.]